MEAFNSGLAKNMQSIRLPDPKELEFYALNSCTGAFRSTLCYKVCYKAQPSHKDFGAPRMEFWQLNGYLSLECSL